jgi:hypothetical protein
VSLDVCLGVDPDAGFKQELCLGRRAVLGKVESAVMPDELREDWLKMPNCCDHFRTD